MTTEGYITRQKTLQNRLMKRHLKPVYNALQWQVNQVIRNIYAAESVTKDPTHAIQLAFNETTAHFHINPMIGPAVMALYEDAGKQAAARIRIQKSLIIPLIGFVKDVIAYFNQYLLDKVVLPISKTTVDEIQKTLKQAISDGWGVDKTVRELKNSPVTKWRAKMIVRTESVAAMNYAQMKEADSSKYEITKKWLSAGDSLVRFGNRPGGHNHLGVDGEMTDLWGQFSNGLLFPGDPNGPANQVINCRCTMSYKVKEDANGNPVRKPVREAIPA